jgi:hypothetical protein
MRLVSGLGIGLLVILAACPCMAITLTGSGEINAKQQRELDTYINYFGRASIFVKEYCYFDEDGNPLNRGKCVAEIPDSPDYAAGSNNSDYARQYYGTPLGKPVADPQKEIHYLRTFPEVWLACNNRRAYGCTLVDSWPESVTIFLTTYDKKLGNITLIHEIEFHAKRDIKH